MYLEKNHYGIRTYLSENIFKIVNLNGAPVSCAAKLNNYTQEQVLALFMSDHRGIVNPIIPRRNPNSL